MPEACGTPSGRPDSPDLGPHPSGAAAFPTGVQTVGAGRRGGAPAPSAAGPPEPGLRTWRRAAPVGPRGRIGRCRRRAPARAASRGLGSPGRPPRQGTRRARPALDTGGSASGPRRHPQGRAPSSDALAPSSLPRAAYLAQARRDEVDRAGLERRDPGGSPMGGVCLVGGVAVRVGDDEGICWFKSPRDFCCIYIYTIHLIPQNNFFGSKSCVFRQ